MQRHGAAFTQAVAVAVAAAAAAATAFAATVSPPLSLCRLWEPPHCPGGTGFPGQKTQKLGKREGACGIATLGRRRDRERQGSAREAGGAGPERAGQEPGRPAPRLGVRVFPSRPASPRRPPHAGSEPRRAPPAMIPDWRWPVSTGRVRATVPVEKGHPWQCAIGASWAPRAGSIDRPFVCGERPR